MPASWLPGRLPLAVGQVRHLVELRSDKRTHRAIAVASISVGTAGYLVMLLANHSPFTHAQNSPTPDASASVSADNGTTAQPVESTETQPVSPSGTRRRLLNPLIRHLNPPTLRPPKPAERRPPGTTSPVPSTTFPMPQHTGVSTLFRDTVLDYATFPRRESTWWILGIGGALAASLHPLDDDVNAHLVSSGSADKIWKPGHIIGGPLMYIAPPAVYVYGRYILPMFNDDATTTNKWSHMGLDLVRAELLEEGLVEAIKVSVNRTRPNGQKYSFPSGPCGSDLRFRLGYRAAPGRSPRAADYSHRDVCGYARDCMTTCIF